MGGHAKDAALAIGIIVDSALALSQADQVSVYSLEVQQIKDNASELVAACNSKDQTDRANMIKFAKDTTTSTQALVDRVKGDPQQEDRANAVAAGVQGVAAATSKLVTSAKEVAANAPGAKEKLDTAYAEVSDSKPLYSLLLAEQTPGRCTSV